MLICNNMNKILNEYEFTDSVITEMKWEDNLLDFSITVDYYWDIHEGKKTSRLLKIVFKDCVKAQFCLAEKVFAVPREHIKPANIISWFTIVLFYDENRYDVKTNFGEFTEIKIHTLDFENPFLHIVCKDMELYHVGCSL